jgi:D-alanyl-lipoteichoic acid acyltransferase DltB (MBOAT superfamily)
MGSDLAINFKLPYFAINRLIFGSAARLLSEWLRDYIFPVRRFILTTCTTGFG